MKKYIVISFALILLFLTIFVSFDKSLLEKFESAKFIKTDSNVFLKKVSDSEFHSFYFDENNVTENYYSYYNGTFTIDYYYFKNHSKIDECLYDIENKEFLSLFPDCEKHVNFLTIIPEVFDQQIKSLNIKKESLEILSSQFWFRLVKT